MSDENHAIGRRWFEEVWNKGRREAIAEMMAPDAVVYEGEIEARGPSGFYLFFDRMRAAFSEMHVTVHDTIAEGDKVCIRWTCRMKHSGDGLGMPPSGRTVETTGISIVRINGGKIVEGWQNWDMLGVMEQIQTGKSGAAGTHLRAG